MKFFFILYGLLAIIMLITGCAAPETRNIRIADKILETKFASDLTEVSAAAARFRKNDFSAEKLKKYTDTTISRLYDALFSVTLFFPGRDTYIDLQKNVLEEKIRRAKHNNSDVERMHWAYIGARMFNKASDIRKRFPDAKFPAIPPTILDSTAGETAWRVYDILNEGKKAELKALPIGVGPKVIMVILTGCPAAEKAMDQIMADLDLAAVFKKYGILLTARFDTKGILLWRNHFNFPEVYIANMASDFAGFDFHSSPKFYFLKNGKIKFSFSGWRKKNKPDYGRTNMRKGLEAISISAGGAHDTNLGPRRPR